MYKRTHAYRRHTTRNKGFASFKGKRYYFPGEFESPKSIAAYHAWLARIEAGLPPIVFKEPKRAKFVIEVGLQYLDHASVVYGLGRSEYGNCKVALDHFHAYCGAIRISELTPKVLKRFQEHLAAKKLGRSYINQTMHKIRRAFRWAASEDIIPVSICHGLDTVAPLRKGHTAAKEKKPKAHVPWEHIEPVLAVVPPVVKALILFQCHTAARSGSVIRATPSQFDRSRQPWDWRPRHKTEDKLEDEDRELILPIGPKCQEVLTPWLDAAAGPDEPLFSPRTIRKNNRYGKRYKTGSYAYAVTKGIRKVNAQRQAEADKAGMKPVLIPHWSPHQLRHSKGQAVRKEYGLEAAQAVLGHDTLQASQIYTSRQLELARKAAMEMG